MEYKLVESNSGGLNKYHVLSRQYYRPSLLFFLS